jgi:hypothetical protein
MPTSGSHRIRGLAAVLVTVLVVVAGGTAAGAHGGPGDAEVGEPESAGDLEIRFPVRITYQNDGHPAEEVEGLAVSGTGPGGATAEAAGPFPDGDAPGVYVITIALPESGTWDLTVTATEPEVEQAVTVEVAAPVPDTDTDDGDDQNDVDLVEPDEPADLDETTDEGASPEDGDEDQFPFIVVLIGFLVATAAGVFAYRWFQSQQARSD